MYESYYGFAEEPFSLRPDPKFLYRRGSQADVFERLHRAIRRRAGLIIVDGDVGTGKTTLCRALVEQIRQATYTALVLDPSLSADDLLRRVLLEFGVATRAELKRGGLARASRQEMIDVLYDFLLGLVPLNVSAVLVVDDAHNLPIGVLEQIRDLSDLERGEEKLLQIVLVGQSNLHRLLRSPELRQLDARVSIRHELEPLDRDAAGAYVVHRLAIAGGSAGVTFTPPALDAVHRLSGGIPRLINLICDRALVAAFAERSRRVVPRMIDEAPEALDMTGAERMRRRRWLPDIRHMSIRAAAAVMLIASALAVGASALVYQRLGKGGASTVDSARARGDATASTTGAIDRRLPSDAVSTILVSSYPLAAPESRMQVRATTEWLERAGFRVYYADVDLGLRGRWQRVLAGAYGDAGAAQAEADRLRRAAPAADPHVVSAVTAAASFVTAGF